MKASFTHTCATYLLHRYPQAWRERYADEALAVLEERPATWRTLFDLLLGIVDAYMHPGFFIERKFIMLQKLRNSQLTIFCLFVLFLSPWFTYNLIFNNLDVTAHMFNETPLPAGSFIQESLNKAGLFAVLVCLVGSMALIIAAFRQALARKHKKFSALFIGWILCAIFCLIAWVISTSPAMRSYLSGIHFLPFDWHLGYIALVMFFLWTVLVAPICLFLAARKAEFHFRFLRITFLSALLVTLLMDIMAGVMLFQAIAITINAPYLSGLKRLVFLNADAILMTFLALLAFVSLLRSWRAQHELALVQI